MKYFDVRFSAAAGSSWPRRPPEFKAIGSPLAQWQDISADELRSLRDLQPGGLSGWLDDIRHAGIHANRYTNPDLLGQLHLALRRPVDTVLCNLLDEDSLIPLGSALAARFPHTLIAGASTLARILGARKLWLVMESAVPNRWSRGLRRLAGKCGGQLLSLRNDYPQAEPTLLLHTLLGRRLRPRNLPVEQGVLVLDAATAVALGRYFASQQPMHHVPLGVYDAIAQTTHYSLVPVGTAIGDVLAALDIAGQNLTLRGGHVLRDLRLCGHSCIDGAELTVHCSRGQSRAHAHPCIRCSWCIDGCPTGVHPAGVLDAAHRDDAELARRYGAHACIECGICSYVCPCGLPLLNGIRRLRQRRRAHVPHTSAPEAAALAPL